MDSNKNNNSFDNSNIEENLDNVNANSKNDATDKKSMDTDDKYKFGWSNYSEITNGRFAMIGFLAIILIELISKQAFLKWGGILN